MRITDKQKRILEKNLVFPVRVYRKENGFLGILSHRNGDYLFCSKSSVQGEYMQMFKDLFIEKVGDKYVELLKVIIDNDISLVFEVVDIDRDPHIIKYTKNSLTFLDTFENSLEDSKGKGIGEVLEVIINTGIEHKKLKNSFYKFESLMSYIELENKNNKTEGIVIEDSEGFMFKVKYDYYNEWKSCRYLIDKINKSNGYFEIRLSQSDLQARFGMWYSKSNYVNKGLSLIELRDLYEIESKNN